MIDLYKKQLDRYLAEVAKQFMDEVYWYENKEEAENKVKEILQRGDLIYFYDVIPDIVLYKGLMSECQNFIQVVNKYKYLFGLCNGREEVENFISRE